MVSIYSRAVAQVCNLNLGAVLANEVRLSKVHLLNLLAYILCLDNDQLRFVSKARFI